MNPRVLKFAKKALPFAIMGLSCAGTIATAYFSAKAGAKSVDVLREAEEKKGEPLTLKEKVDLVGKDYIPAAACAGATIGLNVFGFRHNQKVNAAILGAYAALDNRFKEYRKENPPTILAEDAQDAKVTDVHSTGIAGGYLDSDFGADEEIRLFLDSYSGELFHSTISQVINAEYHFNRNYTLRGDAPLSEYYEFLGITPKKISKEELDTLGWGMESGFEWIDFEHFKAKTDDGIECLVIGFAIDPTPQFCY